MPDPTIITVGGMTRDGFSCDPEPIEGFLEEIRIQDQELCQRYSFPSRKAEYQYSYVVVPSSAAEHTSRSLPPIPVEQHQGEAQGWRNRLVGRLGLGSHKKPKQGMWSDNMDEWMGDPYIKYLCVTRKTPTQRAKRDWSSGQSRFPPGPVVVENRFVVEVDGDRHPPKEEEMRAWRDYVEDCKAHGQKPESSVPVQRGTMRKMF